MPRRNVHTQGRNFPRSHLHHEAVNRADLEVGVRGGDVEVEDLGDALTLLGAELQYGAEPDELAAEAAAVRRGDLGAQSFRWGRTLTQHEQQRL